jgi:transposase
MTKIPAPGQRLALARTFGCARVVFNDGLRLRQQAHEAGLPYPTDAELTARLTAAKATPERAWLAEVSAVVLQQARSGPVPPAPVARETAPVPSHRGTGAVASAGWASPSPERAAAG